MFSVCFIPEKAYINVITSPLEKLLVDRDATDRRKYTHLPLPAILVNHIGNLS